MFNKNFKNLRLTRGLSQKQVAEFLNISPQSISKWEKGEALPSIEFLPKLAECLNCEINDFFIPIADASFDADMLNEFFVFMSERMSDESYKAEEFIPFIKKYPNILGALEVLSEKMEQHQVIKAKNIQGILGCSQQENEIILRHFINHELIEKIDTDDSFFVIKGSFEGLVIIVKLMIETCKIIDKNNQKNAGV